MGPFVPQKGLFFMYAGSCQGNNANHNDSLQDAESSNDDNGLVVRDEN